MKIFIFRVSQYWDYCDGAYIVAANSFEEAQEMSDEYHKLYRNDEEAKKAIGTKYNDIGIQIWKCRDSFTLVAEYECPEVKEKEIILDAYNED